MRNFARGFGWAVAGLGLAMAGGVAGCAWMQPVPVVGGGTGTVLAAGQDAALRQEISGTLDAATAILAQLRAERGAAVSVPAVVSATQASTAPARVEGADNAADREAQVISLLSTALGQLNASLQSAPDAQAQRQAAFATGVQTAESAAVTFGGPYGGLIAAGLGILGVLVQGVINSRSAHQTAQAAHDTAQALAGKLPPAGK